MEKGLGDIGVSTTADSRMTQKPVKGRIAMSIYNNFVEASEEMNEDEAKDFFYILIRYGMRGEFPNLDNMPPMVRICWKMALPKLDKDIAQFYNSKHGGAPKGNHNARKSEDGNNPKSTQHNY